MGRYRSSWMFVVALSLGFAAAASDDARPRGVAPPKRIPDILTGPVQPMGEPVATSEMPRDVRRAVVADAARRFQLPESAVVLARAERVTWSDGALGCPQPGMAYTQALVPGFRVTATTSAGQLLYHTDTRGSVAHCGAALAPGQTPAQRLRGAGATPGTQPAPPSRPER
jgi:hypothetical protein